MSDRFYFGVLKALAIGIVAGFAAIRFLTWLQGT